jgi:hypothetical protein
MNKINYKKVYFTNQNSIINFINPFLEAYLDLIYY